MNRLPAIICANKVDLIDPDEARAMFRIYEDIGYPVIHTSTLTGEGIDALRDVLRGRISVLAGSSGVGRLALARAAAFTFNRRCNARSLSRSRGSTP